MNTFNKTFKQLAIPYFKEVFDSIDAVMLKFEVPYYLVGASAIALQLLRKNLKPSRGTKDIDFAIMISSRKDFDNIVAELKIHGFNKVAASWRLYHPKYDTVIDLLPFGEIEQEFTQDFDEREGSLHILGFREVLENPDEIEIEEKIIKTPTLSGMVILKLIAWSDRPDQRGNDLYDILKVIENYFEIHHDRITEEHFDTFTDDFDPLRIAARVLGRDAAKYIEHSDLLKDRIKKVLDKNTVSPTDSDIARTWAQQRDCSLDDAHSLLKELKTGFFE